LESASQGMGTAGSRRWRGRDGTFDLGDSLIPLPLLFTRTGLFR
jgi:hypothetical protein